MVECFRRVCVVITLFCVNVGYGQKLPFSFPFYLDETDYYADVTETKYKNDAPQETSFKVLKKHGQYVYADFMMDSQLPDQKQSPLHVEMWSANDYVLVCQKGDEAGSSTRATVTPVSNASEITRLIDMSVSLNSLLKNAAELQKYYEDNVSSMTKENDRLYVFSRPLDPVAVTNPCWLKNEIELNDTGHMSGFSGYRKLTESDAWTPLFTWKYSYDSSNLPDKLEVMTNSGKLFSRLELHEFLVGQEVEKVKVFPALLTTGTIVEDSRVSPTLSYVTEGAALLSDEEVFALAAKRKAENDVRLSRDADARSKAAARSAVANDPHNMKDVPVTGESWGNRLRRVPNWAYGGAVVLFLGGWFVAASRRRRK